jgi:phosphate transport system substrate-binding protein
MKKPSIFLHQLKLVSLAMLAAIAFVKCNENPNVQHYTDSPTEGTIHISVDESFKPIIDSQIQVFESQYPKAKIIAEYKPEAECIKDLQKDSTRLIIITREPNQNEITYVQNKISVSLGWTKVAYDAMAIVVNKQSKDSLFSMADLKSILSGTFPKPYKVVMDGLTATSNVRFAKDSILGGGPFGKNVQAADNSQGVIDYVSKTPGAIGFVGVSWVGINDAEQTHFSDKVIVAG